MKSIQTHRIIKDKISHSNEDLLPNNNNNGNGKQLGLMVSQTPQHHGHNNNQMLMKKLAPISAREISHSIQENLHGKGANLFVGLPRIGNGDASSSDRDQINNLQKRIKDLEKENYRLNHHISQAEQTLKNYRDVYGSIPSDPVKSNPPAKISNVQVINKENLTSAEANLAQATAQLQSQLQALEKQLKDSQQRNQDLTQENQKQSNQIKELQSQSRQIEALHQQIKQLQSQHDKDEQQITQLKEEISQYKMRVASLSSPVKSNRASSNDHKQLIKSLQTSLHQLREEYQSTKRTAQDEMISIQSYANAHIEQLQNYFSLILQTASQTIQQQKSEHIVFKVETERTISELQEKIRQLETVASQKPIIKSPVKVAKAEIALSPIKISNDVADVSADDGTNEVETLKRRSQEYQEKIVKTSQAITSLSGLHLAEIKSIKHLAHIRELIRVAKEREQAIDKDRMIIEIKQLKEVQNVLTFALKTAEQSLSESQPQVVAKLIEGRSKRIKLIEQTYKGKLKDIEQRSLETCSVNSSHLEVFQSKAIENQLSAENMTKQATDELLILLKANTDPSL